MKVKIGKNEQECDEVPDTLIIQGYRNKSELDVTKKALESINDLIIGYAEKYLRDAKAGTCHFITDGISATVQRRDSVDVSDSDRLKKELGKRFDDLVTVKIEYKPSKKLVEMSVLEENKAILECLKIKPARPGVTYNCYAGGDN